MKSATERMSHHRRLRSRPLELAIGATFGPQQSMALSLRAQHTSNGGLSDINPGIDMIGLNLTTKF